MDCKRDEAMRAKDIAEKRMQRNDFEGARSMALKGKSLYPELENLNQMLSICDVYCSAKIRILGLMDWYGVLQVEKWADELTIKKQYRQLSLVLHPDKNRFPGAEGAFKLICEANAVLSNPEKRSSYDNKIKGLPKPTSENHPNHQSNRDYQFNQQHGAQNSNASNGFSNQNQHQATQSSPVFWACSYCGTNYPYSRKHCTKCFTDITANEMNDPRVSKVKMGYQCVPSKPEVRQTDVFEKKVGTNSENGVQNVKAPSMSRPQSPETGTQKSGDSESINVENAAEDLKTNETVNLNASCSRGIKVGVPSDGDAVRGESKNTRTQSWNKRKLELEPSDGSDNDVEVMTEQETLEVIASSLRRKKVAVTSNDDAVHGISKNIRTKSRNIRRKLELESELESSDGSDTNKEDMTDQENLGDADPRSEAVRRSSRRRHHIFYQEPDEDDIARPLKRSHTTEEANGKEHNDDVDSEDSEHSFPAVPDSSKSRNKSKVSLKNKNGGCDKGEINKVTSGRSSATADFVVIDTETETDSSLDLSSSTSSDSLVLKCSDPEFSDFDKLREESKFRVNQFWACYDTNSESMPRFYAKVRKVCSSPFELDITWLDAVAIDDSWEKWVDEGLPVGCGSFKLGKNDKISGCLSLSHQVHCEKGKKNGYFSIYPREGEVWALYRDWDISWSSKPENVKKCSYEIVEVLSDFDAGIGIKVVYLDKITGFVSLFRGAVQSETSSFIIKPSELYKFSHHVPSSKMTGDEGLGVPIGSFELDPASLPINPDNLYVSSKGKIVSRDEDCGVSSPLPRYSEGKGKDVLVSRDEDCGDPSPLPMNGEGKGKDVALGSARSPDNIIDLEGGKDVASRNVKRLTKWVFRPGLLGSSYFSFEPNEVNFFRPKRFR